MPFDQNKSPKSPEAPGTAISSFTQEEMQKKIDGIYEKYREDSDYSYHYKMREEIYVSGKKEGTMARNWENNNHPKKEATAKYCIIEGLGNGDWMRVHAIATGAHLENFLNSEDAQLIVKSGVKRTMSRPWDYNLRFMIKVLKLAHLEDVINSPEVKKAIWDYFFNAMQSGLPEDFERKLNDVKDVISPEEFFGSAKAQSAAKIAVKEMLKDQRLSIDWAELLVRKFNLSKESIKSSEMQRLATKQVCEYLSRGEVGEAHQLVEIFMIDAIDNAVKDISAVIKRGFKK